MKLTRKDERLFIEQHKVEKLEAALIAKYAKEGSPNALISYDEHGEVVVQVPLYGPSRDEEVLLADRRVKQARHVANAVIALLGEPVPLLIRVNAEGVAVLDPARGIRLVQVPPEDVTNGTNVTVPFWIEHPALAPKAPEEETPDETSDQPAGETPEA